MFDRVLFGAALRSVLLVLLKVVPSTMWFRPEAIFFRSFEPASFGFMPKAQLVVADSLAAGLQAGDAGACRRVIACSSIIHD